MRQRTVLAAVALVAVALAVVGAGLVTASSSVQENNSTDSAPAGATITSFMQASAAQTEGDVDRGMWQSAFERATESERARLVHERSETLSARADRLEQRRNELPDNASSVAAVARLAAFNGQAQSLNVAIDDASAAAERANVSPPGLEKAKEKAKGLEKERPGLPDVVTDDPNDDTPGAGTPGKPDDPGNAPDAPPGQDKTTTTTTTEESETTSPDPPDTSDPPGSPDDPGNGGGGPPTDDPGNGDGGSGGPPTNDELTTRSTDS